MSYQDLIGKRSIDEILSSRKIALTQFEQGMKMINQAAKTLANGGYGDKAMYNTFERWSFLNIDNSGNLVGLQKRFASEIDKDLWRYLGDLTGMVQLMDHQAKDEWLKGISENPPECSIENLESTFSQLDKNKTLIFQRGLVRAFSNLCGRYKTNDAFKVGKKIIIHNATGWYGKGDDYLNDVERVLYVLDKKKPPVYDESVRHFLSKTSGSYISPEAGVFQTEYMKVRLFKNRNAHVWLLRDDLTAKINKIIASYHGSTLPDGRNI